MLEKIGCQVDCAKGIIEKVLTIHTAQTDDIKLVPIRLAAENEYLEGPVTAQTHLSSAGLLKWIEVPLGK